MNLTSDEYQRLERICAAIARRKMQLFEAFHAVSVEDVAQVALVGASNASLGGALRAHESYDPSTCPVDVAPSYTSWIGRAANSAIIDWARSLRRNQVREIRVGLSGTGAGQERADFPTFTNGGPTCAENPKLFLAVPARLNRGHGTELNCGAYAQALSYREEHGLSWRGLWLRFRLDAPLVRLMGFKRAPARSSLHLAQRRLRRWHERNA